MSNTEGSSSSSGTGSSPAFEQWWEIHREELLKGCQHANWSYGVFAEAVWKAAVMNGPLTVEQINERLKERHSDWYVTEIGGGSTLRIVDCEGDHFGHVPRDTSPEAILAIEPMLRRAQETGIRIGRGQLQREMRTLLGAASQPEPPI